MMGIKYLKTLLFTFTIFFAFSALSANPNIEINDMNADIPLNPKVHTGTLDNGLFYYVMENKKPENRAELQMVVKAGSLQEEDDQAGLAHFIEHMCFNGTKNFPENELVSFLESLGMKFGGDINANTGFERTYYMLTIPLDRENILDTGFQVLKDWLHNVSFAPEELEKERGVIHEEWRVYLSANQRMMKKHFPYIFYKSRYVDRLPIGDTNVILNAPRQRFIDFYKDWYRPNISAIIAVGDFDAKEVIEMIKKKFGDIKNPDNPKKLVEFPIVSHKETFVSIAQDKEMPYSQIAFYFKHPGKPDLTYKTYKQNLIDRLLSSILSKRLAELSKKSTPPFLFANAAETHFMSNMEAFYLMGVLKEDAIEEGIMAMLGEAFRAKEHGITQTELDREKNEMMTFIRKAHKEKDKTESIAYAREMARNFYEDEAAPGIDIELELYELWMPQITLEDLQNVLKEGISRENLAIMLSLPEKEGFTPPNKKQILDAYSKAEKATYEPYVDNVADSPLFNKKVRKGKIINQKKMKDLDLTMFKLSNGIKVYLKPTDFKNDEILMNAFSFGGNSQIDDKTYLSASVAADLIDEAGISEFDQIQLGKLLSGKVLRISPFIGKNAEGFTGSSSPQDLETLFQLINLYFTAPRQDDEAYQSYMAKMKESLKNSKLSPRSAFSDTINYVISSYHHRGKPFTEESLAEIDYQKSFDFYKERFADASDFNFVFVGAFNVDEIKPLIQKYLGSLPKKNRKEKAKDIGIKYPSGKINKEVFKGMEKQSTVRLIFSGDFDWNKDNRFNLSAMTQVLNIKMREAIREDKGGTYGVYSRGRASQYPAPSYRIDINFGTNPDRVPELVGNIEEIIKSMQTDLVDETYIQKVKEILKRDFETSQKENRFWLRKIYDGLYNGDNLMDILAFNDRVEKLSAEDVRKAAKAYFNWNNYASFVLYPEK